MEIGKLMQDFFYEKPDDMYYKELADRSRYFKETKGCIMKMSGIMKELTQKGSFSPLIFVRYSIQQ